MTTVHSSVLIALFNGADPAHHQALVWLRGSLEDAEPLRAPVTALAEVASRISAGTGDKQLGRDVA